MSLETEILLDFNSIESYRTFLRIKSLPRYRFQGHAAYVPNEYVGLLGVVAGGDGSDQPYVPSPFLFDYQRDITALAIRKRKFALFVGCGWGKTLCMTEYMRHVARVLPPSRRVLMVSPLMVISQTLAEVKRFYGDSLPMEHVRPAGLQAWLDGSGDCRVGITNYEAIREGLRPGRLGCLVAEESSCIKSQYGAWGQRLIELGKGLDWKLCATGTPAPNDRIEYGNHAVFLDQFPTLNAFLSRYFVNRGETANRWELKPHALRPFFRSLSHWAIFMDSPASYGWKDNAQSIPPINVHIHDVGLTDEQQAAVSSVSGMMIGSPGGITSRGKLMQLAKGQHGGKPIASDKPAYIRSLIDSWPGESTIVWVRYNAEQDLMERTLPGCGSVRGATSHDERVRIVTDFQKGRTKILLSKPEVLGLGLNLQVATRQVFNGLWDSAEDYHQAVKRSNRVGSTRPLNVHIPITPIEQAMVDTVMSKLSRIEEDAAEQEQIFREVRFNV